MARPKLQADKRHDIQRNVNLTNKQDSILQAHADYLDIPFQVLLRIVVERDIDEWIIPANTSLANHINQ